MRLSECPVLAFSEAFGRLGLSLSHVRDNTFFLVGPGGFEVTTFQLGEALGNGATVEEAAKRIVDEHRAASAPAEPESPPRAPTKRSSQLPPKEEL